MIRIAMWSGPRNISTAMMRSWESRSDTFVVDEPFYPYYLSQTDVEHPGREEIIAKGELDKENVSIGLITDTQDVCSIYYQKHITHHLLPSISRKWMENVENCFLIRDPNDMIIELPVTMNVGDESECGDSGDLNGDGDVSILDIIAMINCILEEACPDCSDLNEDNTINIQDIITLINIILY